VQILLFSPRPIGQTFGAFIHLQEGEMFELEMKDDVETEEFGDELFDEALDREQETIRPCCHFCHAAP
jgi:hypothetical protein